jgi:hypothetical protein
VDAGVVCFPLELLTGRSAADTTNDMDLPQWVGSILELMQDAATEPRGAQPGATTAASMS